MFLRHVAKSRLLKLKQDIRCGIVRRRSADLSQGVPLYSQEFARIISRAEEYVESPYTYTTRDWLRSDQLTLGAPELLRQLILSVPLSHFGATNESRNSIPWPLVVLLFAKAVHQSSSLQTTEPNDEKIKMLAKVTELLAITHNLHDKVYNRTEVDGNDSLDLPNKISILLGDYIYSQACTILHERLGSSDLILAMSCALRDLSESGFNGIRDLHNISLLRPTEPHMLKDDGMFNLSTSTSIALNSAENEWTNRSIVDGASLLGRGCESVMMLFKQSKTSQLKAYQFGVHSGIAWQAAYDIASFISPSSDTFSLVGAPVLLAVRTEPVLYDYIVPGMRDANSIDYEGLRRDINKTKAVEDATSIYLKHADKAKAILDNVIGNNMATKLLKTLMTIDVFPNK